MLDDLKKIWCIHDAWIYDRIEKNIVNKIVPEQMEKAKTLKVKERQKMKKTGKMVRLHMNWRVQKNERE